MGIRLVPPKNFSVESFAMTDVRSAKSSRSQNKDAQTETYTGVAVATAGEQAILLFERALQSVATQNKAAEVNTPTRLFFPSGIELITIKFDVGTAAKIVFTVAGKDAKYGASESLMIEDAADYPGDLAGPG